MVLGECPRAKPLYPPPLPHGYASRLTSLPATFVATLGRVCLCLPHSKYMIDWMLNGEPPYELTEFDTARYGEWATPEYTAAKVRESYGWNNVVVYPDLERTAGRPCRVTGVHDALAAKGAHFGFHNGWEVPKWFDSSVDAPVQTPPTPVRRRRRMLSLLAGCVTRTCRGPAPVLRSAMRRPASGAPAGSSQ